MTHSLLEQMLSAVGQLQKSLVPSLAMYGKKREYREMKYRVQQLVCHNNEANIFKENYLNNG